MTLALLTLGAVICLVTGMAVGAWLVSAERDADYAEALDAMRRLR